MKIAALLMVKNEARRVAATVASVQDDVDALLIFDTGSSDNTIELACAACTKIPSIVREGVFENFSQARNDSLDFANEMAVKHGFDMCLVLDANDELRRSTADSAAIPLNARDFDAAANVFLIERRLENGAQTLNFHDGKLLRLPCQFRYSGVVHEQLNASGCIAVVDSHHLFQDRTHDDDKSRARWERDIVLLEKELESDPNNSRTMFHLARSYALCGIDDVKSYRLFKQCTKMSNACPEQRFLSAGACGQLSENLGKPDRAIGWYMQAIFMNPDRIEAYVGIAFILIGRKQFHLALPFARLACEKYPPTDPRMQFESSMFTYRRWNVLSVAAGATGDWALAKTACERALMSGQSRPEDKLNMEIIEKMV